MADATAALGVYQPRRPPTSSLFRLVQDHLLRLQTVYDERFAREYGPWRPVVAEVAEKFLACGVLEHGFARIRCDACAHEYLLAFSCKGRYCCPSCHAKRLAIWAQWLDTRRLAPVPHRQVVLTIPKRLRAYGRYRRRLLGEIARVAARTLTAAIRTLTGQRDLAVGIVACLQTHGSRANWHPHLHLLVTDGGFRPDGTCVSWPVHDTARATEAFRRAVLRLFVRLALFDEDQAAAMLTWPHSGVPVQTAVWVAEDDRAVATRLARSGARSGARNPVALERLTYDRAAGGDVPLRQVGRPHSRDRDGGPAGVPGAGAGAPPRQGPRHHQVLWLVRQSPARHAAPSGARHGRRAGPDRARSTARTERGQPPMGGAPAAELRSRPTRVPALPRDHADRRLHHLSLGDRSDPDPPPHARHPWSAAWRAEPALVPGAGGTRHDATTDRHRRAPPRPRSTAPVPRRRAGAVRRARGSRVGRASHRTRVAMTAGSPDRTARAAGGRATVPAPPPPPVVARRGTSPHTSTTPIQIPMVRASISPSNCKESSVGVGTNGCGRSLPASARRGSGLPPAAEGRSRCPARREGP